MTIPQALQDIKPGTRVLTGQNKVGVRGERGGIPTVEYFDDGFDYLDNEEIFTGLIVEGQSLLVGDIFRLPRESTVKHGTVTFTKTGADRWKTAGRDQTWDNQSMRHTTLHSLPKPEKAEPERLKKGDWVLVWAMVHDPSPEDDEIVELRVRVRGGGMAVMYTTDDAIVRPDKGTLPVWVRTERIDKIAEVLMEEGGMERDAALTTAASLHRAGVEVSR